jgi:hypothetical protein
MLNRLRQLVLCLMAVMVLVSPFMQLDSFDAFPRSTDDIELQMIFALALIGMFLVFVGVATLLPELIMAAFRRNMVPLHTVEFELAGVRSASAVFSPPLRN